MGLSVRRGCVGTSTKIDVMEWLVTLTVNGCGWMVCSDVELVLICFQCSDWVFCRVDSADHCE